MTDESVTQCINKDTFFSLKQATPDLTLHGERVKPSYTSLLDTRNGFSGSGQVIGRTELLKRLTGSPLLFAPVFAACPLFSLVCTNPKPGTG